MSTNVNPGQGKLRERRRSRGLSQQELAQRAACSVSYVALLEKGFTPASSDVVRRIAAVLDDDERRVASATLDRTPVAVGDRDDSSDQRPSTAELLEDREVLEDGLVPPGARGARAVTEYANGADGTCQTCGAPTAEAWHAYCRECWAEEQGCRPRRNDEREGAAAVTAVSDAFGDCVDRGRRRLLYPYRRTLRLCIDCLHERRQGGGAA